MTALNSESVIPLKPHRNVKYALRALPLHLFLQQDTGFKLRTTKAEWVVFSLFHKADFMLCVNHPTLFLLLFMTLGEQSLL